MCVCVFIKLHITTQSGPVILVIDPPEGCVCVFALNSMFVRLGTDYEIRNGGYFESIKNSANQFISKP